MSSVTRIQCDRCGQLTDANGCDWVSLTVAPSTCGYLPVNDGKIDLCDQCEQMMAAWMRGQPDVLRHDRSGLSDEQARRCAIIEETLKANDEKAKARRRDRWRGKNRG